MNGETLPAILQMSRQPDEQPVFRLSELDWLYVRIYCQREQADEVLVGLLAPCMQQLQACGLIQRFFFIRYFEGGFHLRLRCCGKKADLLGPVREDLTARIGAYFARQGDTVLNPRNWGPEGMHDPTWRREQGEEIRPVPSFEYDRYEPEYMRYGGNAGMSVSEEHFLVSSEVVLRLLEYELRSGKNRRRNMVFLLLRDLALAFSLQESDLAHVFAQQARYWIASSWITPQIRDMLEPAYQQHQHALEQLLTWQPGEHKPQAISLWSVLQAPWREANTRTYRALLELDEQRQLIERPETILFSYMHMLCNRMGFFPREEAYLVYLLSRHYQVHTQAQEAPRL